MSTGFSHLDEFERRLAEMEQEMENEEALRSQCDQIGEGLLRRSENNWDISPPPSRANSDNDNYWEETFENYQKTENTLIKISSSENQDEALFDEKKTTPSYEPFAAGEERHTIQNSGDLTGKQLKIQKTGNLYHQEDQLPKSQHQQLFCLL